MEIDHKMYQQLLHEMLTVSTYSRMEWMVGNMRLCLILTL